MPKCKVCGYRLGDGVAKCPMCGAILPAGAKFCNECGARQGGQTAQTVQQNVHTQKNVTSATSAKHSATANVTSSGLKETPMEAFEYEVRDGKYILTRLKDTSLTEVVIPHIFSEIQAWKDYRGFVNGAFVDCTELKSIAIPDSVTSIGDDAFHGCKFLENIHISGNAKIPLKEIEKTIADCDNLKTITIGNKTMRVKQRLLGGIKLEEM